MSGNIHWTPDQVKHAQEKVKIKRIGKYDVQVPALDNPFDAPYMKPKKQGRAKLKRHERGKMNNTEARFNDEYITPRKLTGEFLQSWFEAVTFLIAKDCRYSPDFMVLTAEGEIVFYEVKGTTRNKQKKEIAYTQDDAAVKIKVAAEMFPFSFFIAYKSKIDGWIINEK